MIWFWGWRCLFVNSEINIWRCFWWEHLISILALKRSLGVLRHIWTTYCACFDLVSWRFHSLKLLRIIILCRLSFMIPTKFISSSDIFNWNDWWKCLSMNFSLCLKIWYFYVCGLIKGRWISRFRICW